MAIMGPNGSGKTTALKLMSRVTYPTSGALRVAPTESPDTFSVSGRGELHLTVLIETMRREGYELGVSKPQVVVVERDSKKMEPVEYVVIDVAEEHAGAAIESLGKRRASMLNMLHYGSQQRLEYTSPLNRMKGMCNVRPCMGP